MLEVASHDPSDMCSIFEISRIYERRYFHVQEVRVTVEKCRKCRTMRWCHATLGLSAAWRVYRVCFTV